MIEVLKPAVARLWLPGRGCTDIRSPSLSDADAVKLLQLIQGLEMADKLQVSDAPRILLSDRGKPIGAYRARQSPDPDHPQRSATVVLVVKLPEPISQSSAAAAVGDIPLPQTMDEVQNLGWLYVREPAVPSPPVPTPRIRLGAWSSACATITVIAICVVWSFLSDRNTAEPVTPGRTPAENESIDLEWAEMESDIKASLRRIVPDDSATNSIGDEELLRRFTARFERPEIKDWLSEKERDDFEGFAKAGKSHPFLAFFDRLPKSVPQPKLPYKASWPAMATAYLVPLAEVLERNGVKLRKTPNDLVYDLVDVLNYERFLSNCGDQQLGKLDRECKEWDNTPFFLWQGPVRKALREMYSR